MQNYILNLCEYLVMYVRHMDVRTHNIRNSSSGRFKLASHFNVHPGKEKVLLTDFRIFEVVPRLVGGNLMACLRDSVFGYRLSICGWKYLLSKYATHSLC